MCTSNSKPTDGLENSTVPSFQKARIRRDNAGDFHIDVRGLELALGRFPIDLHSWSPPIGKRVLAATVPGSSDDVRFAIGEVQIEDSGTTLVLFGIPEFETHKLIF